MKKYDNYAIIPKKGGILKYNDSQSLLDDLYEKLTDKGYSMLLKPDKYLLETHIKNYFTNSGTVETIKAVKNTFDTIISYFRLKGCEKDISTLIKFQSYFI